MHYDSETSYIQNIDPPVERFLKKNGFKIDWLSEHYIGSTNKSKRYKYWLYGVYGSGGYVFVTDNKTGIINLHDYSFSEQDVVEYEDKYDLHKKLAPLIEKLEKRGEKNRQKRAKRQIKYNIRVLKSGVKKMKNDEMKKQFEIIGAESEFKQIEHHIEQIEKVVELLG